MLKQSKNKPECCKKWEARPNKDTDWCSTFKKLQNIQEIKLKGFQIRLVHRTLATNFVLMHMVRPNENNINCSYFRREGDYIYHVLEMSEHKVIPGTDLKLK